MTFFCSVRFGGFFCLESLVFTLLKINPRSKTSCFARNSILGFYSPIGHTSYAHWFMLRD